MPPRTAIFLAATALACASLAIAQPATAVRIASLDTMSGPMAGLGLNILKSFQYSARLANEQSWAGAVRFEIVPFDNRLSAQEALSLLQSIIGQNIRYVVQGASSSAVGLALQEAIEKHNGRNPGKEIIYLNYAAQAPQMTNARCSYWHFRTDANSDMKVAALASYLVGQKEVQRVFLLNPNYAYGQEVSRAARSMLATKRPDLKIVGDDFHPLGLVKDFSPYIAKIKQSGADAVITADFGADLALIVRTAREAGLTAVFYTLNGNNFGVPSAMGAAGQGRVKLVSAFSPNSPPLVGDPLLPGFRRQFNEDFINGQGHNALLMLAQAIREAGSVEPAAVAARMSGMRFQGVNGPVEMRSSDHQAQQPIHVLSWEPVDGKTVVHDQEGTGLGWKPVAMVPAQAAALDTRCQMKRPP
ncbi:MAG: branched-chain amino acid ABC transporter substrate-binding protein [Comamonas sp.]|jgi:branched-chain amino acid transport system substrate-binding protein|uniref:branched-chain amino acid ABC transporter substrate-binding protein n=1 Tax=Comamonas sp. TaxID=34028 RepID=UPI0012D297F6|nr:branched-chain amino acid ABC transporter substrate-binding protein [Comamonas sp.]MDR3067132.1 branched-chain amino acid ABC transporter substrate-binding protein [Comamonas sp.]MPS94822.1 branched-chain amino acid ABC transporter substrate-binding protein [Comamonas sp.]